MKYTLIDYNAWDFKGKGLNLEKLLNSKEKKIWNAALPFLDKRDNLGHAEIVTYFAFKLLDIFPQANQNIVIPAAILHDIGWSQMTNIELKLFYITDNDGKGAELWRRYEPILRARHQELGVDMAKTILKKENLPKEEISHICKIILGHDTRKGFYSSEDGIVRSADKLYRFTYPHLGQALRNRKTWTIEKIDKLMGDWINKSEYFWGDEENIKKIALIEKQNTLMYNQKYPILKTQSNERN